MIFTFLEKGMIKFHFFIAASASYLVEYRYACSC